MNQGCMEDIPDFDILVRAESFQDVLRRDTHGAKPVQDRLVEPADSSKLGLDLSLQQIRKSPVC